MPCKLGDVMYETHACPCMVHETCMFHESCMHEGKNTCIVAPVSMGAFAVYMSVCQCKKKCCMNPIHAKHVPWSMHHAWKYSCCKCEHESLQEMTANAMWTWSCHVWNPCMLMNDSCILHVPWIKHAWMKNHMHVASVCLTAFAIYIHGS